MASFELSPASRSDIPEIVEVARAAFRVDPIFLLMKRDCALPEIQTYDARYYNNTFDMPGVRFFKIVDAETGKMAAFCKWRFPHTVEETIPAPEAPKDEVPKGFNEALHEDFIEKLTASRKEHLDISKDYFVNMLATHPAYQRRGLGRRLLEQGCALADRDGAKMYLEASSVGLPLYKSLGWVQVGNFDIDLARFGGEGVEPVPLMIRVPGEARGV